MKIIRSIYFESDMIEHIQERAAENEISFNKQVELMLTSDAGTFAPRRIITIQLNMIIKILEENKIDEVIIKGVQSHLEIIDKNVEKL